MIRYDQFLFANHTIYDVRIMKKINYIYGNNRSQLLSLYMVATPFGGIECDPKNGIFADISNFAYFQSEASL